MKSVINNIGIFAFGLSVVLANIYKSRKNHKLDEWSNGFISWIESLPWSKVITD